jgi:uncharacterized membrane protein YeaQ/YmgE (transglycosylase-associated protein family)
MDAFKNTILGLIALGVISSLIATVIWQKKEALDYFKNTILGLALFFMGSALVGIFIWQKWLKNEGGHDSGRSQGVEQTLRESKSSPSSVAEPLVSGVPEAPIKSYGDQQPNSRVEGGLSDAKPTNSESPASSSPGGDSKSLVTSIPDTPNRSNGEPEANSKFGSSFPDPYTPNSGNPAPPITSVTPPNTSTKFDERTLRLTRMTRSEARMATIIAPGIGLQNVNVFHIDTRDFADGGTLVIDIEIPRNSATDGSFDLFPDDVPIPVQGRPAGTLTGRYDVPKGSSTRFEYRFGRGQVFALNLEGNWYSPKGATGLVRFRVSVRE